MATLRLSTSSKHAFEKVEITIFLFHAKFSSLPRLSRDQSPYHHEFNQAKSIKISLLCKMKSKEGNKNFLFRICQWTFLHFQTFSHKFFFRFKWVVHPRRGFCFILSCIDYHHIFSVRDERIQENQTA